MKKKKSICCFGKSPLRERFPLPEIAGLQEILPVTSSLLTRKPSSRDGEQSTNNVELYQSTVSTRCHESFPLITGQLTDYYIIYTSIYDEMIIVYSCRENDENKGHLSSSSVSSQCTMSSSLVSLLDRSSFRKAVANKTSVT